MKYREDLEEILVTAKEKVADVAEMLEDFLPDAAQELRWMCENLKEEILGVRSGEALEGGM